MDLLEEVEAQVHLVQLVELANEAPEDQQERQAREVNLDALEKQDQLVCV